MRSLSSVSNLLSVFCLRCQTRAQHKCLLATTYHCTQLIYQTTRYQIPCQSVVGVLLEVPPHQTKPQHTISHKTLPGHAPNSNFGKHKNLIFCPKFQDTKNYFVVSFLHVSIKYRILFRPYQIFIPEMWYLGLEIFGVLLILCWAGCTDRGLLCKAFSAKATASNRSFLKECGDTNIWFYQILNINKY